MTPSNLPKYSCPNLVSQSGYWVIPLPDKFANKGTVVTFWMDKKGRMFYRVNQSSPVQVQCDACTAEPLWALIDVYGVTSEVQLLGRMLMDQE